MPKGHKPISHNRELTIGPKPTSDQETAARVLWEKGHTVADISAVTGMSHKRVLLVCSKKKMNVGQSIRLGLEGRG